VTGGDQRGAGAVLQRRAMANPVQPKAASSRSRRIDGSGSQISGTRSRADTVAGTRAPILSVLQANGAGPFDLGGVGDQHAPAALLERVVDEARAVHRIDHPADRPRPHRRPGREAAQPVGVGRRGPLVDDLAPRRRQADLDLASTHIQSSVQHEDGPLELAPR
jgi:hypothetical protein